jgi:hypothetical protein
MFDFGLQNHFCYSIGNVQLAHISQPDRRLSGGGYLSHRVRSSSRSTTYSVFRQLDPAFRRVALPAFMPSFIYRVVTTVINSSIFSNNVQLVEMRGFEPLTSAVQGRRSPN